MEDDDGSSSGEYTPENSLVNQLLNSMEAGGNADLMRLIASNRLGNARNTGVASVVPVGSGAHHPSRSTYFKAVYNCLCIITIPLI